MPIDNSEQIAEWNGALGQRWVAMQREIDRIVVPFGGAALKVAAPQPGERVIDVGCGCGDTSIEIARLVGKSGAVLGVDVSAPMLGVARSRTTQADCANLTFYEGDASETELPANTDLLFSRFGVMFFGQPTQALNHLRVSLREGGRCAFVCWRSPRDNPWAMVPLSAARAAMNAHSPLGERIESLGHGYKELEIPPANELPPAVLRLSGGHDQFALEPNALHIWPRGGYMCIALPNTEGSFTVTLFLPAQGAAPSFATLPDAASAAAFFSQQFPGLLSLIPRFNEDFEAHPVGTLSTLYLDRWHLDGRALLIGDAAHAIVPFHGQGMNCGFEDTVVLANLLAEAPNDSADVFAEFQRIRQPDANAIAAMALENYIEMRDSVADPHYLAKRELGALLATRVPQHYMARYRMVTFTHLPYAYALERGRAQDRLLEELLAGSPQVATIDIDAAAQLFVSTLPPLPALRHG